ncbi:dihydrodipicolinate synthase family protein [Actinomadura spongiicola]|uniref:dihydrodipicolinate synthase family protein n=1 Tax=Actinomadura spongiicola TaxID=2303421 RepID=UPI001F332F94|nr:dihydrodipicolinate synthase family protein [Actinomadura spongiicola]
MTAVETSLVLPASDGRLVTHRLGRPREFPVPSSPPTSRVAFAAAHVVGVPGDRTALDWDATLAYRRHLWTHGFRVAEAMDTAQRGAGLDWATTRELIRRSVAEAHAVGGGIACGAGTDHLPPDAPVSLADVRAAYEEQGAFVEGEGAQTIVMASRALARQARSADDYREVYGQVLRQLTHPAILHWLGEPFDPALRGYWGSTDLDEATDLVLELIDEHRDRIDGIKISLLDADREVALRRRLPEGVRLYTGDDFNYVELIRGDGHGHSDALLGVFDAIAPAAGAALAALDAGDVARYEVLLAPTVPLARHLFSEPTYNYKTGIVFLAYLNGHQESFSMVGGLETARSAVHLAETVVLADRAGLLHDPEQAAARASAVFAAAGIT